MRACVFLSFLCKKKRKDGPPCPAALVCAGVIICVGCGSCAGATVGPLGSPFSAKEKKKENFDCPSSWRSPPAETSDTAQAFFCLREKKRYVFPTYGRPTPPVWSFFFFTAVVAFFFLGTPQPMDALEKMWRPG
nr:hypothetical protein [Pandoravirus massiliensis]